MCGLRNGCEYGVLARRSLSCRCKANLGVSVAPRVKRMTPRKISANRAFHSEVERCRYVERALLKDVWVIAGVDLTQRRKPE